MRSHDFVKLVDHTALKPEATAADIDVLCAEAIEHRFEAVCVNSMWIPRCAELLAGRGIGVCSVVGFPLGSMNTAGLIAEVASAVASGATEIDMVVSVGLLKAGDDARAEEVVAAVVEAVGPDVLVKVILETALLTDQEIVRACQLSVAGGAGFVKTSTGFNPAGGATAEAVALMRKTVGPDVGVKASGGIRTLDDVVTMVDAGASRLGMSAGVGVIESLVE